MTQEERNMVQLVQDVDSWAQENYKPLDRQLEAIYLGAKDTDNGWESVLKSSPGKFYQAYGLALEYRQRAGV